MPTTAAVAPTTDCLTVDRKQLLTALDRVRAVVPTRCLKPILSGVRLECADSELQLSATDGEIKLLTRIEAEGHLPPCVVSCAELMRRVKALKEASCTLSVRARPPRLTINGGHVEHTLPAMSEEDFPPVPQRYQGDTITLNAEELRTQLAVVGHAIARERIGVME